MKLVQWNFNLDWSGGKRKCKGDFNFRFLKSNVICCLKNWKQHMWNTETHNFLEMEVGDPADTNTLKKAYL